MQAWYIRQPTAQQTLTHFLSIRTELTKAHQPTAASQAFIFRLLELERLFFCTMAQMPTVCVSYLNGVLMRCVCAFLQVDTHLRIYFLPFIEVFVVLVLIASTSSANGCWCCCACRSYLYCEFWMVFSPLCLESFISKIEVIKSICVCKPTFQPPRSVSWCSTFVFCDLSSRTRHVTGRVSFWSSLLSPNYL